MIKGSGFSQDDVDIIENLIIANLVESSFFSLKSASYESGGSDLVISGSVGYIYENQISLKLWLVDNRSGQIILARELPMDSESFFIQLESFSSEFISTVYQYLYGATEENIRKLIEMEQYEYANLLLNYYREKKGDQSLLKDLELQINNGYAAALKQEILQKIKQNQPLEADGEILQYILYSSSEDVGFLEQTEEYQLRYMEDAVTSLTKEVEKHLRQNNPELSLFLYNNFTAKYGTGPDIPQLYRLKREIDEALKQAALKRAESGLANRDYAESEYEITLAINSVSDPADDEVNEKLEQWETEKEKQNLKESKTEETENPWTAGFRKKQDISLSLNTLYVFDTEHELLMNGFFFYPEITYQFQKPLLPPFYLTYSIGLDFMPGSSSYTNNGSTIYTDFYWGNILPGIGIMTSFQKMDFLVGLTGEAGFLYREIDYSETLGTETGKSSFTLGFGISAGWRYYLTEFLTAGVGLNYRSDYVIGAGWLRGFGVTAGVSIAF